MRKKSRKTRPPRPGKAPSSSPARPRERAARPPIRSPDGEPCHVFKILANKPLALRYALLPRPRGIGPAVRRFLENVKVGR